VQQQHHARMSPRQLQRPAAMARDHRPMGDLLRPGQSVQAHQVGPVPPQLVGQRAAWVFHDQIRGPHQPPGATLVTEARRSEMHLTERGLRGPATNDIHVIYSCSFLKATASYVGNVYKGKASCPCERAPNMGWKPMPQEWYLSCKPP